MVVLTLLCYHEGRHPKHSAVNVAFTSASFSKSSMNQVLSPLSRLLSCPRVFLFPRVPRSFFPSFHVLFIFKNCLFDMVSLCDSMDFERFPPPTPFHECWNYRGVAPMPTILQHSIGGLDRLVTLGHCGHINRMIVWRARANQGRWWVTALLVVWLPSFVRLTRIKGFLGFLSSRMALRW